jgi:hypothetical protein
LRLFDVAGDIQALQNLLPLQLADAQLQTIAEIFKQYPPRTPNLAVVRAATEKCEALRARMLAGEAGVLTPEEQQALAKTMEEAFSEIPERPVADTQPFTGLTPQESLLWAILTPTQQGLLLKSGDADGATKRALAILCRLREAEEQTWPAARDRMALALSEGSGALGTPARENRRQMILDFLERVRKMPNTDFAAKQQQLGGELTAALPPGLNLMMALVQGEPWVVHDALRHSLLEGRAAELLLAMQAARAAKAGQ